MAIPVTTAIDGDTMRAITAATSTRTSRPGPRVNTSPDVVVVIGAERMVATAARTPATTHTSVDIRRTLMPARRAASALAAEARTAMPYLVRFRNTAMAAVSSGMTTRMATCSPRTTTPKTFHVWWIGVGNDVNCDGCGSLTWAKRRSWATPMVATVTITRGA